MESSSPRLANSNPRLPVFPYVLLFEGEFELLRLLLGLLFPPLTGLLRFGLFESFLSPREERFCGLGDSEEYELDLPRFRGGDRALRTGERDVDLDRRGLRGGERLRRRTGDDLRGGVLPRLGGDLRLCDNGERARPAGLPLTLRGEVLIGERFLRRNGGEEFRREGEIGRRRGGESPRRRGDSPRRFIGDLRNGERDLRRNVGDSL